MTGPGRPLGRPTGWKSEKSLEGAGPNGSQDAHGPALLLRRPGQMDVRRRGSVSARCGSEENDRGRRVGRPARRRTVRSSIAGLAPDVRLGAYLLQSGGGMDGIRLYLGPALYPPQLDDESAPKRYLDAGRRIRS